MRVPVDSLSDIRWARIERSLFQRLDSGEEPPPSERARAHGWRPGAILIAASAAAAIFGGVLAMELVHRAPASASASHIETRSSASHVVVGDASLDVAPESEVVVAGNGERGLSVTLDRGRVECEVAPRGERPPFFVQAGDVRVRVVGTRFAVTRAREVVSVDVTKGVVQVESHGAIQRVAAGQHWSSSDGLAAPPGPSAIAPAASLERGPQAAVPVAPLDTPAPLSAAERPQTRPPAAAERPPTRPSAAAAPRVRNSSPQRRTHALPPTAPAGTSAAPAQAAPLAGTSRQAQYERAEGIEPNDPEGALAMYKRLAEGGDTWAGEALFSAGHVALQRGTGGEAQELFEQYLQRFPRGSHAEEARENLALIRRLLAR
jgi:hypothetical protein